MRDDIQKSEAWLRLIGILGPSLLFGALLVLLPILSLRGLLLYSAASGLYMELGAPQVGMAVFSVCLAAWSIMYTQALLVGLVVVRYASPNPQAPGAYLLPLIDPARVVGDPGSEILPPGAWQFLNTRIRLDQLRDFSLLILPTFLMLVIWGKGGWLRLGVAVLAVAVAYLVFLLFFIPGYLARTLDESFNPAPGFKALARALRLGRWRFLLILRKWLSVLGRGMLKKIGMGPQDLMPLDHYTALFVVLGLLLAIWFIKTLFHPLDPGLFNGGWRGPALMYLHWLFTLFVWLATGIRFYGSILLPRAIPVWVGLLGLGLFGQWLHPKIHTFHVEYLSASAGHPPRDLSPSAVARASKTGARNLVVVTATGGGIQAAGWTTYALCELIKTRKNLYKEIRLLSTVSGGSVGTAFYLDARNRNSGDSPEGVASLAYRRATKSGLEAIAWGFVSRDFWRLPSFNFLPCDSRQDRGLLLEESWRMVAGYPKWHGSESLVALQPAIAKGDLPGFIFNASNLETGRRIALTPLDLGSLRTGADSLAEMVTQSPNPRGVDLDLFTAARTSATFPYVTPLTRAATKDGFENHPEAGHHLGDGGYTDNYGVATALEWLDQVLTDQDQLCGKRDFDRVLIIQLRSFPTDSKAKNAEAGFRAGLIGPLDLLLEARTGNILQRNEAETARFLVHWNTRLKDRVQIATVVIEPKQLKDPAPLSWRLSPTQEEELKAGWGDENREVAAAVHRFLEGKESAEVLNGLLVKKRIAGPM